jgi:hypothetical protein
MNLSRTAERALTAYGGADRWREARAVEATVTVGGLLFRLKRRMPVPRARVRTEIWRPRARIDPIGQSGAVGVLEALDVRIETPGGGETAAHRRDARAYFPYGRRWFAWDELDLAYFLGYAFWNYFALPALLLRDDVAWTEASEGVLVPRFPAHLPTHGRDQRLLFDRETGLLRRYDYRPEVVVGALPLTVGNLVLEHAVSEGVPYPSRRRVTPIRRKDARLLGRPVMVTIEVEDWRLL